MDAVEDLATMLMIRAVLAEPVKGFVPGRDSCRRKISAPVIASQRFSASTRARRAPWPAGRRILIAEVVGWSG